MSEKELKQVYDLIIHIEIDTTPLDDSELLERGEMAERILTFFSNAYIKSPIYFLINQIE